MRTLRKVCPSIMVVLFLIISGASYALDPVVVSFNKGVEYASQGEFIKAKEEFEKSLKANRFFGPAEYRLEVIQDVIEQNIDKEAAVHLFMGVSYSIKGQVDQAIKSYIKALVIDPGFAVAYADRGDAHHQKGRLDQAISDYSKVIGINPKDAISHLNRGNVYRDKGQDEKAIKDYTSAIDINPRFAAPYINRGNAYSKKGQVVLAFKDYNQAIEINPKFAAAYYSRGKAYSDKGQLGQAIRDYTKAIEINPKYTLAYLNRGFIHFVRLGDKVKGCADWKIACDLGRCGNYHKARKQGDCLHRNSVFNASPLSGFSGKWDLKGFVVGGKTPLSLFECRETRADFTTTRIVSFSTACNQVGDYYLRLSKRASETDAYLITVNSNAGISIDDFPVTYVDGKGWSGEGDQLVNGETVSITAMVQRIEGRNWHGWTVQVFPTSIRGLSLDEIKEPFFKADLTRRK